MKRWIKIMILFSLCISFTACDDKSKRNEKVEEERINAEKSIEVIVNEKDVLEDGNQQEFKLAFQNVGDLNIYRFYFAMICFDDQENFVPTNGEYVSIGVWGDLSVDQGILFPKQKTDTDLYGFPYAEGKIQNVKLVVFRVDDEYGNAWKLENALKIINNIAGRKLKINEPSWVIN